MTHDEVKDAVKIAKKVLGGSKINNRRITISKDDIEAFDLLWGLYNDEVEGSGHHWITEEERQKISKLRGKIYGKKF